MTKEELLKFVVESPASAVELILKLSERVPAVPVTSSNSVAEIIAGTISTIHLNGLLNELKDLPDISGKLSPNLDQLVAKLRKVK